VQLAKQAQEEEQEAQQQQQQQQQQQLPPGMDPTHRQKQKGRKKKIRPSSPISSPAKRASAPAAPAPIQSQHQAPSVPSLDLQEQVDTDDMFAISSSVSYSIKHHTVMQ
jgi:hypothetical protein